MIIILLYYFTIEINLVFTTIYREPYNMNDMNDNMEKL